MSDCAPRRRESHRSPASMCRTCHRRLPPPARCCARGRIIDVEVAWNFAHEDLLVNQGGVVAGVPGTDADSINHGTAAVGVFSGDGTGITGICRAADVTGIAPTGSLSTAAAIHG